MIAGGGTGGHIIPALNIAYALQQIDIEAEFLFMGAERGLEKDIIPGRGFNIEFIDAAPWEGKSSLKNLWHSVKQVKSAIKRFHPHCAIGTGGYVSAPLALAAPFKRIALFWQEQNTYPGSATKLASLFARRIFLGFEDAKKHLWRGKNAIHSGNPVKLSLSSKGKRALRKELGINPELKTVFLTGGSQGAAPLNEAMFELVKQFGIPGDAQLLWQCGKKEYKALAEEIGSLSQRISLHPFIDDMAIAYGASDLVICRAGALTLAEIAVAGLPAVLIPFPHAAADHQRKNARSFTHSGSAVMIDQNDLTPALLCATIRDLLDNPKRLIKMSEKVRQLGKPNAAKQIAGEIIELLRS